MMCKHYLTTCSKAIIFPSTQFICLSHRHHWLSKCGYVPAAVMLSVSRSTSSNGSDASMNLPRRLDRDDPGTIFDTMPVETFWLPRLWWWWCPLLLFRWLKCRSGGLAVAWTWGDIELPPEVDPPLVEPVVVDLYEMWTNCLLLI